MFFLIAGPCVVENFEVCDEIASKVKSLCVDRGIPYIFKASYKKANRTSLDSFTGIGDRDALEIIKTIGDKYDLRTTTDIHNVPETRLAAEYVDVLQVPAFLSRQTELLQEAGRQKKIVNIKKGQFLSGESMSHAVEKVKNEDPDVEVWLTERGTTFGYQDLVVDFRNIPVMRNTGCPVVMDCTHSLQRPNQGTGVTGGSPEFIGTIVKAAIATGADGLFIETHPDPSKAKSDGANMLALDKLEPILDQAVAIYQALNQ